MLFLHATHHHAEMARLDHDSHTLWLDSLLNGLRNLSRKPFLNLQTPREDFDQPGNFAQADYFAVRDVGYVDLTKKRQNVMLTQAEHLHVFDDHHLVISHSEQGFLEHRLGIFLVA